MEDHTYINVHRGNCPFWCQVRSFGHVQQLRPLDASENRVANYSRRVVRAGIILMIDVMLHRHRHRSTQRKRELPNRSPATALGPTLNVHSCVLSDSFGVTRATRETVTRHRTHDSPSRTTGRQPRALTSSAVSSAHNHAHNVQKHELHDMFSYHDDITRPSCDPARPHAWAHATRRRRARVPRAGAAPGTRTRSVHRGVTSVCREH